MNIDDNVFILSVEAGDIVPIFYDSVEFQAAEILVVEEPVESFTPTIPECMTEQPSEIMYEDGSGIPLWQWEAFNEASLNGTSSPLAYNLVQGWHWTGA